METVTVTQSPIVETVTITQLGETVAISQQGADLVDILITDGPQGPQGEQGEQGPQGEQGIQGETGEVDVLQLDDEAAYDALPSKDPNTLYYW